MAATTARRQSMQVTYLDHVTVLITDVERSQRFYADVLGLREVPPPYTFDFVVIWFDLGGQYLHLLHKPQADTISPRHFALGVDDAVAARERCRMNGLTIDETVRIPNADRFFIRDPDGNRIELIQWMKPYDPTAR
jgi:catechol 2,3-dioxygenase-like lactoylglutathione lyase family enzyme